MSKTFVFMAFFFIPCNVYADWVEVTLLSGEWKDWKLALQKISRGSGNFNDRRYSSGRDTTLYGGMKFRLFGFGPKFGGSRRNYQHQSGQDQNHQHYGVNETNIPRILLYSKASIEGGSKLIIQSRPAPGPQATWREKFIIDTNKSENDFLTLELRVLIPLYKHTLSIGSKTIPIKTLTATSKIWNFSFSSGKLSILVRKLATNVVVKNLIIRANYNQRLYNKTYQSEATVEIPTNYQPTFYARGTIRFLLGNVCPFYQQSSKHKNKKIVSFPDGSHDVIFSSVTRTMITNVSQHFNHMKTVYKCDMLNYGALRVRCRSSNNFGGAFFSIGRYHVLPITRYPVTCQLVGAFNGERGYRVDVVLTPRQRQQEDW